MSKKKILLYGVATFKNRGVEAIINSTINQIDLNKYSITAGSYDLESNSKKYNDKINYVNHNRKDNLTFEEKELEKQYQNMPFDYNNFELLYQKDVVNEMKTSDICISVGGDNYCYSPCSWLYALDNKSKSLGKKTILWGASLFEKLTDVELIENLNKFDVLVIRESLTLNAVKEYIDEEKIIFAPDPAFSLETKEVELDKWYQNKEYVILNVSPLTIKNEEGYKAIIDLMKYILKNTKYSICLLPHVTTDSCNDLDILKRLKDSFKNEKRVYLEKDKYDCTELKYIISKSTITIAARTHASIAAYSNCIPTLVIGYSVKSKGIAKDLFGTYDNYVIDSQKLTSKLIIENFNYIDDHKEEIRKTLEKQMPKIKDDAKHIFDKVIEKLDEQDNRICPKENCLGCGLCSYICPVNAISMKKNIEGYIYPFIDAKKCINCGKCKKMCPVLNKQKEVEYNRKYYAIKNKDLDERKKSTSGGAFSILARNVLSKNGIVYGCELKNNKASHVRIDSIENLSKIRGSKYIQSNIEGVFNQIKKDLDNAKIVLFSGTPCQIGIIKSFFKDNKNLITVSVVCHGVMNDKMLIEYINYIENKEKKKLSDWNFRSKINNTWLKSSISYRMNNELVTKDFMNDSLMYLYLKNMVLRESCYRCQYKNKKNVADLIIADYWGIEVTNKEFFDDNGVSALIINSEKGEKFFKSINIEKYAYVTSGNIRDIKKYNPSFFNSVDRPKARNYMVSLFYNNDIQTIVFELKKKDLELQLKTKDEKIEELLRQNIELSKTIQSITSSKRWIMTDKIFNFFNKIFRR